jgi:hypothetical protein
MLKSIRIAGVCLVSMLAMSMALAASASAAPHWLVCLPEHSGTTTTKWNSHQCETAASGGGWEWSELSGTEASRGIGLTLTLRDKHLASAVQCVGGEEEGSVGPKNLGRINTAEVVPASTHCTRLEGGCLAGDVEKVEGIHLPWQVELAEKEGKILEILTGTGNGNPGWKIVCKTAGGKLTDECESENGEEERLLLANVVTVGAETPLLVLGTFETAHKGECSGSNKEVGEVEGQVGILLKNKWALEVSK